MVLAMRVVTHKNRLPRDVVESPSSETFKTQLEQPAVMAPALTRGLKSPEMPARFIQSLCL